MAVPGVAATPSPAATSRRSSPPSRPTPRRRSIALVGHEPHLSEFATSLLFPLAERPAIEMKKGAVAYLECAEPAAGSTAILRWLLPPRILRRLT